MNEIEVLLHAIRMESKSEREAFLARECQDDPGKLAAIQKVLSEDDLRKRIADIDAADQQKRIGELLSQARRSESAADEATGIMLPEEDPGLQKTSREKPTPTEGITIAERYILQDKIGEGGMGEVWCAKQFAPVKRRVALKLIKRGMDSEAVLARFEQERQALALMDHPNIAQVLDGGVTETGQSFFVMELVNGLPLTKFADESKLSTAERLELFVPICHAVQHAHQKGIVHRDLKPANIMVTMIDGKPVPKVIDFGVAKATGGSLSEQSVETQFGAVIGTLEYMSPEQAGYSGVDIDTRADIYSLGVVLYELLTGLRPIDQTRLKEAGLAEMIRVIKEDDPSRPSTRLSTSQSLPSLAAVRRIEPRRLTALLKGELDWVVMKCLQKSRDRRYDTANGLARDIQRFLAGEVVEARPASAGYRLSKFLSRNKGPVIASGLVVGALIAGVAGTTWGWVESRRQAEVARLEAITQSAISAFLRDDILAQASSQTQSESIFQPDPDLKVRTALDRAARNINERFAEQPLVAAALHRTIGQAYSDLGEYAAGRPHLEKSIELYHSQGHSEDDPDAFLAKQSLGYLYLQQQEVDKAEELFSAALDRRRGGEETRESLRAAVHLAHCYEMQASLNVDSSKRELAKQLYQDTLTSQRRLLGDKDLDVLKTLSSLTTLYRAESFATADPTLLDLAERTIQEAVDCSEELPAGHPSRLSFQYSLALIVSDKKEYDRALKIREEVLAGCIRTFGEVNPTTARAMDSLATNYMLINRIDEAESYYLKSLATRRQLYGNDHPVTGHAVFSIGQFYYNAGNMEKAEPYYRERLERNRRLQGKDAVNTHLAGRDLAMIYSALGRAEEAETLLSQAIEGFKKHFEDSNPIVVLTREYQADVLMGLGRMEEALKIYVGGVTLLKSQPNPDPIALASSIAGLGQCQLVMEQFEDAEASFREATELFTKYIPEAWPSFVYKSKIGVALLGQQRFAEAEPILLESFEAIKVRRASVPPQLYIEAIDALIKLYEATETPEEVSRWQKEREAIGSGAF